MIKARIKELLKEKGVTQKDLAERLNVKQETVSRQISGNPTLNTLKDIASALDVEVKDLFTESLPDENDIFIIKDGRQISIGKIDLSKL